MAAADSPAEAIATVLDQRLAHARALVTRVDGLSPAERRAIHAMQWLASQADRRGTLEGLAQLSAPMPNDGGDAATALAQAEAAHADDPQDWGKARRGGVAGSTTAIVGRKWLPGACLDPPNSCRHDMWR